MPEFFMPELFIKELWRQEVLASEDIAIPGTIKSRNRLERIESFFQEGWQNYMRAKKNLYGMLDTF